jgi:exosome complex exonuclease DIS3/RRP44
LLAASIGHSALTQQLNAKDVQKTAEIINRRHRLADHAGRDSARLYTYIFFRGKTMSEPAYIMNIAENGFSILVPRYGIEGKVYISQPGVKNGWRFDLKNRSITSPDGLRTLNVLDRVMVDMHIDESKPHEPKLVFKCTDPNISMVSASASAPSTPTQQKNKASATESEEKNVKKRKSQEGGQSQLKPPTPKTAKNK